MTDNFEFVKVFNKEKLEFDLAGTRYSKDLVKNKNKIKVNLKLFLEKEENNNVYSAMIKTVKLDSKLKDEEITASVKVIFE